MQIFSDDKPSVSLVLGGGGFVGSALRRSLSADNREVTVLSRSPPSILHANETWITGDFADEALLDSVLRPGMDVYHLISGAVPAKGNWDVEQEILSSVIPTLKLLKAAVAKGVRRIIYVSSGGTVYGVPTSVPIREDAPTDPISAYGVAKLAVEKYLALFERHHGLSYRILRVANPYGPGQLPNRQQGVVANLLYQALSGRPFEIWGDGSAARDFIHVDDVARSLRAAADYEGDERIFNIGSGVAIPISKIVDDIAQAMKITSPSIIHHPSRQHDVPVNCLDIGKAKFELGWTPNSSWPTGIDSIVFWLKNQMNDDQV